MTDHQTETMIIDKGNGWKQLLKYKLVLVHRTGFLGVWDSLVSWLTANPRKTIPETLTFSVHVKGDASVYIHDASIEIKETLKDDND